jgi:hypothetical protein
VTDARHLLQLAVDRGTPIVSVCKVSVSVL